MTTNKHFLYGIILFLIIAILGLGAIAWQTLALRTVDSLSSVDDFDGQLLIYDTASEKHEASLYRLHDAAPETFPGNSWETVFLAPYEVYIFGFFPRTPDQQYLFRSTPRGGQVIDISSLPGEVTNIFQNADESLVAISGLTNITTSSPRTEPYTCVVEKKALPDLSGCQQLKGELITDEYYNPQSAYQAWWHDAVPTELYIRELGPQSSALYTLDVTSQTLTPIADDGQVPPTKPRLDERATISPGGYTLKRSSHIVRVISPEGNREAFFRLSPDVETYWLSDTLLLGIQDGAAYLIDPQTKKRQFFVDLPERYSLDFFREQVPADEAIESGLEEDPQ